MALKFTSDGDVESPAVARFDDVYAAIAEVIDPCSDAMGRPLSLVEMNLLRRIEIAGETVVVGISLTEPTCMYTFVIAEQVTNVIQARCGEQLVVKIELESDLPNGLWTEAQLSGVAATRLEALRDGDRASLAASAMNEQPV